MYYITLTLHMSFCVLLIGLVLMHHGKGADIGAAFGSGASQTVFGSQGTSGFMIKTISTLAAGFFITSLTLGALASYQGKQWPALVPDRISKQLSDQVPTVVQSAPTPAEPTTTDPKL